MRFQYFRKRRGLTISSKKSLEPDSNQWPKDICPYFSTTVLRSTNWAIEGYMSQTIRIALSIDWYRTFFHNSKYHAKHTRYFEVYWNRSFFIFTRIYRFMCLIYECLEIMIIISFIYFFDLLLDEISVSRNNQGTLIPFLLRHEPSSNYCSSSMHGYFPRITNWNPFFSV